MARQGHLLERPKIMSSKFVVLCDMDGVVWLAREPIAGASEAIASLRSVGHRVLFVTNNSYATRLEQAESLGKIGIPATGDVLTSAMAAASLVESGSRVLVCGGPGLVEAVSERGARAVSVHEFDDGAESIDAVVVGFHRTFDYEGLRKASLAIRNGARFIASNTDPTYPTPKGPIPGGGSIVAAVAAASGATPEIAGKPHSSMASLVRRVHPEVTEDAVMIGDRPSTDGQFALELGCRFALVHSDVSFEESHVLSTSNRLRVDFEGPTLRDVARLILEHG